MTDTEEYGLNQPLTSHDAIPAEAVKLPSGKYAPKVVTVSEDGSDPSAAFAAIGTTVDAPLAGETAESATARTGISLWKRTVNKLIDLKAVLGATNGAAVVTDANGTIQQYLRGIVKFLADTTASAVSIANGDNVAQGSTTDAAASSSVAEDATARTGIGLWKAIKNILILINAKLVAGTVIGATQDAGPSQTVARTYTTSSDMTTAAAITPAPAGGQYTYIMDLIVSTNTAMTFDIEDETTGTVLQQYYLSAYSTIQISPRGYIKGGATDKKIFGKASVAGSISIRAVSFSGS